MATTPRARFNALSIEPGQTLTLDAHGLPFVAETRGGVSHVEGTTVHGPILVTRDARYRCIDVAYVTRDNTGYVHASSMMIGMNERGVLDGFSVLGRALESLILAAQAR